MKSTLLGAQWSSSTSKSESIPFHEQGLRRWLVSLISNNKFQYIKRQDVAGLGNEEQKARNNSAENLTFGDENAGDTPSHKSSAIDKLISIDQLFMKFTIRDLAENGMEIIFYDSKDRVKTTMVWTPPKERIIKTKMRTASKSSTTNIPEFDTGGEMLIAGSGNSVYIRDIRVKKKEKIQIGHDIDTRSYEWCTIF